MDESRKKKTSHIQISIRLSGSHTTASLPAPSAALHILKSIIPVAMILALARVRPAAFAGMIAYFASSERGEVWMGGAEDGDSERGDDCEELELHLGKNCFFYSKK